MPTLEELGIGGGWIPSPPDAGDYRLAAIRPDLLTEESLNPPATYSLRAFAPLIGNQGQTNSCVAWACVRAFRTRQRILGLPDYDGAELFAYFNARAYQGWQNQDSGAYIRDGIKGLADHGNAEEPTWPWNPAQVVGTPPPAAAVTNGLTHQALRYISVPIDRQQWKTLIFEGHPVVYGMTLYENTNQAVQTGDWPMPAGKTIGGHALVADGYDPEFAEVPNSWGTGVGRAGFFRVPWAYIESQAADAWIIETVEGEPTPPPPGPDEVTSAMVNHAADELKRFVANWWALRDLSAVDQRVLRDWLPNQFG